MSGLVQGMLGLRKTTLHPLKHQSKRNILITQNFVIKFMELISVDKGKFYKSFVLEKIRCVTGLYMYMTGHKYIETVWLDRCYVLYELFKRVLFTSCPR